MSPRDGDQSPDQRNAEEDRRQRGRPIEESFTHGDDLRSANLADFLAKLYRLRREGDESALWVLMEDLGRQMSVVRHAYGGFKTLIDGVLFGDPEHGYASRFDTLESGVKAHVTAQVQQVKADISAEVAPVKRKVDWLFKGLAVVGSVLVAVAIFTLGYIVVNALHIPTGTPSPATTPTAANFLPLMVYALPKLKKSDSS